MVGAREVGGGWTRRQRASAHSGAITTIGEWSHAPSLVSRRCLLRCPRSPFLRMVSSDGVEPHPSRRHPLWLYHLDYHLKTTSHPLFMWASPPLNRQVFLNPRGHSLREPLLWTMTVPFWTQSQSTKLPHAAGSSLGSQSPKTSWDDFLLLCPIFTPEPLIPCIGRDPREPRGVPYHPFLLEKNFNLDFGCAGSSLLRGFHCGAFSNCSAWASLAITSLFLGSMGSRAHGLSRCGAGLSCSRTRGIFLDQGLKLCPLHGQADSYPLYHKERPILSSFKLLTGCLTRVIRHFPTGPSQDAAEGPAASVV